MRRAKREPRGSWSVDRVVSELRKLHAGGEIMNRANLMAIGESALVSAVERYCGSFARAAKLAGVDYVSAKPQWTSKGVLDELRRLHRAGEALNSEELRRRGHGSVISAAKKHFGNWRCAIAKAGVPAFKRGRWTSWDKIETQLRALHAKGVKMSSSSLRERGFADLFEAARVSAGSWNEALEKAGVPLVMTYERWTADDVIAGLRRLHAAGELGSNLAIAKGHRKLVKAATRHFKTWRLACYAAIPGHKPPLTNWTVHRVLRGIRNRHAAGKSIRSTDVQRDEQPLAAAARRLGLTWREACRRAGVPASAYAPKVTTKRVRWTRAMIIETLRAAAAANTPLTIKSFPPGFVAAVMYRWDSWAAAMASARLARRYKRDREASIAARLGGRFVRRKARGATR